MTFRIVAGESSSPDWRDNTRGSDRLTVDDVALDQRLEQISSARIYHFVTLFRQGFRRALLL